MSSKKTNTKTKVEEPVVTPEPVAVTDPVAEPDAGQTANTDEPDPTIDVTSTPEDQVDPDPVVTPEPVVEPEEDVPNDMKQFTVKLLPNGNPIAQEKIAAKLTRLGIEFVQDGNTFILGKTDDEEYAMETKKYLIGKGFKAVIE